MEETGTFQLTKMSKKEYISTIPDNESYQVGKTGSSLYPLKKQSLMKQKGGKT